MRNRLVALCLLMFAAAIASVGQGRQAQVRQYNPATEVTVKGVVQDVYHPTGTNGTLGTHFNLKTESGTIEVHAGPQWFMAKQDFSLDKGTMLSVTGSKQVVAGKDILIARELKNGDKTLTLRDTAGIPRWSRSGATGNCRVDPNFLPMRL